jgi:hypothetical protein
MTAVLRICWTFFTTIPLQRVLNVIGVAWFALAVVAWLLSGEFAYLVPGYIVLVASAAFPAFFVAPALFRSLSALRVYQLLPHFRLRMLVAATLLLVLVVVAIAVVLAPALTAERTLPISVVAYPLAFLVALFLLVFLAVGDWRWLVLLPLAFVTFVSLRRLGVPALPASIWSTTALVAWATFAAWYLRVRQVRGIMLMPSQRAAGVDTTRPVPRTVAIRTLLASNAPLVLLAVGVVVGVAIAGLPLTLMFLFAERSVATVRQSRLLWLRIPGSRDAVRRQVEKALWRNWTIACAFLIVVAVVTLSPLVGAGVAEVFLWFAVAAGAAIYGAYVALAAVPSVATYFWGFGSMAVLQIVLLALPTPSLTAMVVVAELVGAALFRALAVARWRRIDWLRFKPLPALVGVRRALDWS